MSEELVSKCKDLESQLVNYKSGVDALSAQLDAHKQMLNESLNTILQLRTQLIMMQKNVNENVVKNQNLEKELASVKEKLVACEEGRQTESVA